MMMLVLGGGAAVLANDVNQDASDVALDSPIRALELGINEVRADLDLDLKNATNERRLVKLTLLDRPTDWDIDIWNRFFDFRITQIVVEPEDDTPGQRPRLRIDFPDPRPQSGDYSFTLVVSDPDDKVEYDRAKFTITVPEPPAAEDDDREVSIHTDFPILEGPANTVYEFEVNITNKTGEDASFELGGTVVAPDGQPLQGWALGFEPAFGENKRISSVSVNSSLSERVDVSITPPLFTDAGDYFIPVRIGNEEYEANTMLQLTIAGRGELTVTTPDGRLNVDATAGKEGAAVVRVGNIGTADLTDIALLADTPPNWVVTFTPNVIESLPRNTVIDIPFTISPPDSAVPGDYMIKLRSRNNEASSVADIRVTVEQSTIWGWLGLLLVIVVLASLGGLFWRLGRR
jgi:uncharacterized membrane protein